MGRVAVDVLLTNSSDLVLQQARALATGIVRQLRVPGVVDTGASHLVIPKRVADQLGLTAAGKAKVRYADGRKATRQIVRGVEVELLGRQGTFRAVVEPNRADVLIGAIVLEDLDLLVDCRTQTLHPRDPNVIVTEIE